MKCELCGTPVKVMGKTGATRYYKPNFDMQSAINNFAYWHNKVQKCPEMLLSSHHAKSDECAEIMKHYDRAIKSLIRSSVKEE